MFYFHESAEDYSLLRIPKNRAYLLGLEQLGSSTVQSSKQIFTGPGWHGQAKVSGEQPPPEILRNSPNQGFSNIQG